MGFAIHSGLLIACTLLFFQLPSQSAWASEIGVVGDTHGAVSDTLKAIAELKADGAKYLVLTGDLVGFENDNPLYDRWQNRAALNLSPSETQVLKKALQQQAHQQLTELLDGIERLGYKRSDIFAVSGNWEKFWAPKALEILEDRTQLVSYSHDGKGIANIGGKKVMISHYPQFPIPKQYLPSMAIEEDAFLMSKMSPFGYPSEPVDLVVFGHTHEPVNYYDAKARAPVLNPGSLATNRMEEGKRAYALVDLQKNTVETRNAAGKKMKLEALGGGHQAIKPAVGTKSEAVSEPSDTRQTGKVNADPTSNACGLSMGQALIDLLK